MKPSTFFAIFIPVFAAVISTLFIILTKNKKPNPKMVKLAIFTATMGLLIFTLVFFIVYM
jgi:hypothetical protein